MENWVLVDPCVWALFFTKPGSAEKSAVDKLLDLDRVALIGAVVAEVLMGFRRPDQASWVASRLRVSNYIETEWADWQAAADLGRELASKGNKLPLTDLLVAAAALRRNAWVYTTDPHFDLVPSLKRHVPG